MNTVRMMRMLRKMSIHDLLFEGDDYLNETFSPFRYMARDVKDDPALPQEIRKIMNLVNPERQYL